MSIDKPFFRIWRSSSPIEEYLADDVYADGRSRLCHAYEIIVRDLLKVFEYVDPTNDNLNAYSHRLFELLLRASTEFETNCKRILCANGYPKPSGKMNISDYRRINAACRLSDYRLHLGLWSPPMLLRPFEAWAGPSGQPDWYQAYTHAKHDRLVRFSEASLGNVVRAVAGLLTVLFAQFGAFAFNPYQDQDMYVSDDEGFLWADTSIFRMNPPAWSGDHEYGFNWTVLRQTPEPCRRFPFEQV